MTKVRTSRTRRTWAEKLMLWKRAYRTKISDGHDEAIGRGSTRCPRGSVARENLTDRLLVFPSHRTDSDHALGVQ